MMRISLLQRNRCSELRRRIVRRAVRPLLRGGSARPPTASDLSCAEIHRILVCRPNHRLGNLVLLTPLVGELQRLFPDARVDIVLAGSRGAELFRAFDNIGRVYTLAHRIVRHPIATCRVAVEIRRAHYDLAIDPCETSQSGRLLVALAGARYLLGGPAAGGPVPPAARRAPAHMAQWPVHALRMRARPAPAAEGEYPAPDLRLSLAERTAARARLAEAVHATGDAHPWPVIGIFTEATGAKGFGVDWWRRFIAELRAQHAGAAILEIVPADGRPRLSGEVPFLGSPSPREVAAVISNMTCFVSADCGVMHLANAAGVPTLGLFSVTDAKKYAPYGHGSQGLDAGGRAPEEITERAEAWVQTFCDDTRGRPPRPLHAGDGAQ